MRPLVALAALILVVAGAAVWVMGRAPEFDFRPWPAAPQLRSLPQGTASGPAMLIGLDAGEEMPADLPADLCPPLFGEVPGGAVPVAYFTDHYCPNCRQMAEALAGTEGIAITRHELPLLGPASVVAARAALAAERQGALDAFHRRMLRATFQPTETYLRDVARGLGLDPDRLLADMESAAVADELAASRGLASRLGFGAVPVTVVGRTVVVGSIPQRRLEQLVTVEARAGSPCPLVSG